MEIKDNFKAERLTTAQIGLSYLLAEASHTKKMSNSIYSFMKKYDIGESAYGKAMDAVGSHITNHRLYGHHLIADFPKNLKDVTDFLLHEISDGFTDFGLPILPGKLIENTSIFDYCKSISNNPNWNMINGFDILAGTLAIYSGGKLLIEAFDGNLIVDNLESAAATFGVGAIEFAISLSTANPFLLAGCFLHLLAGIKGLLNERPAIYFVRLGNCYRIEFVSNAWDINVRSDGWLIGNSTRKYYIDSDSEKYKM